MNRLRCPKRDRGVRVDEPAHWIIAGWYMVPNEEFDWMSPRNHLRQKSWDERVDVGHRALIEFGVLKK